MLPRTFASSTDTTPLSVWSPLPSTTTVLTGFDEPEPHAAPVPSDAASRNTKGAERKRVERSEPVEDRGKRMMKASPGNLHEMCQDNGAIKPTCPTSKS